MVGVDQSIESLNLNEFDYVEEVKNTPNKKQNNEKNTKEQETKKAANNWACLTNSVLVD